MATIFYSYEIGIREFEARVLFAILAAKRGHSVIIGPRHDVIRFGVKNPGGILIEKGISKSKGRKLKDIRGKFKFILNICEESTAYIDAHKYIDRLFDSDGLNYVDEIYALGAQHKKDLCKYRPKHSHKIIETGNPRFDVYSVKKYRYAKKRNENDEKIILINTNFAINNNPDNSDDFYGKESQRSSGDSQTYLDYLKKYRDQKDIQMDLLRQALIVLSKKFPEYRVLVRPHPVESLDNWMEWGRTHGVEVKRNGPVLNCIRESDVVVHTGCTTAIEAAICQKPTISFSPTIAEQGILPNNIGLTANSAHELVSQVFQLTQSKNNMMEDIEETVCEHIKNFRGGAITTILDRIDLMVLNNEKTLKTPYLNYHRHRASVFMMCRLIWHRFGLGKVGKIGLYSKADIGRIMTSFDVESRGVVSFNSISPYSWIFQPKGR